MSRLVSAILYPVCMFTMQVLLAAIIAYGYCCQIYFTYRFNAGHPELYFDDSFRDDIELQVFQVLPKVQLASLTEILTRVLNGIDRAPWTTTVDRLLDWMMFSREFIHSQNDDDLTKVRGFLTAPSARFCSHLIVLYFQTYYISKR